MLWLLDDYELPVHKVQTKDFSNLFFFGGGGGVAFKWKTLSTGGVIILKEDL
jgi:hypothetical protein